VPRIDGGVYRVTLVGGAIAGVILASLSGVLVIMIVIYVTYLKYLELMAARAKAAADEEAKRGSAEGDLENQITSSPNKSHMTDDEDEEPLQGAGDDNELEPLDEASDEDDEDERETNVRFE